MVLSKHLHRLRKDQRGTVSVIMGLLIVPLVGALGIGFEVSNWYMTTRGMQNAADAAALAAASNGGAQLRRHAKRGRGAEGLLGRYTRARFRESHTRTSPSTGPTSVSRPYHAL